MRLRQFLLLLAAVATLALVSYVLFHRVYLPRKFARLTNQIIERVISGFDRDQLAGQAIHIAVPGTELNEQTRKIISELKPGGIIFFGFNLQSPAQIAKFTADLQALAAELNLPPFLISTDQEGGYVRRVREGVLQTPPARNLGDAGDRELCRATGYYVSRDLGKLGINVFFAPIVDINNNPQNPVIGLRSFGTTLPAVLQCALPFEQGARQAMLEGGAMPVIKHFPGHGDTHTDSHWALPVINKPMAALREFELVPFREAILHGARAVMTAHILYPQIDPAHPATLSETWLTQTLRGELGFTGVVFTDAMEMSAVSENFKTLDRPVTALNAGADILLYTSWQDEPPLAKKNIAGALENGQLTVQRDADGHYHSLGRALRNQLAQKLPYLDLGRYLDAEDARWYAEYRKQPAAGTTDKPVGYSVDEVMQKYNAIRWSQKTKKGGPVWLAGQKNKQ